MLNEQAFEQGKLATLLQTLTYCNSNDGYHKLGSTAPSLRHASGRV